MYFTKHVMFTLEYFLFIKFTLKISQANQNYNYMILKQDYSKRRKLWDPQQNKQMS